MILSSSKNYADAFKERSSKAAQIPIQSEDIDNLLKPNESYFTNISHSQPDDLSVVDDVPARNQSESNDKNYPSIYQRVLPDVDDNFSSHQSST